MDRILKRERKKLEEENSHKVAALDECKGHIIDGYIVQENGIVRDSEHKIVGRLNDLNRIAELEKIALENTELIGDMNVTILKLEAERERR